MSIHTDVKDLFVFCRAWIRMINLHHSHEDSHLFPGLIKLTGRENIVLAEQELDRKSTRLNSSHSQISYAVFCLKKKKHRSERTQLFETQDFLSLFDVKQND